MRLTFTEIYDHWFYGDSPIGPAPYVVIPGLKTAHEIRLRDTPFVEYMMSDASSPIIARVDGGDPGDEDDMVSIA